MYYVVNHLLTALNTFSFLLSSYNFHVFFIFPDLLGENAGGPGNALGFQIFGGPILTVLASKTSREFWQIIYNHKINLFYE